MKKCSTCKETKEPSEFHKHAGKPDGLQPACKACAKIRNRKYYLATPEKNELRRKSNNQKIQRNREYVWDYLLEHPCIDCGISNPVVLEFDHVRGTKIAPVSELIRSGSSIEKIKSEIEKCDVRCANCHRIVTAIRGNWWSK